MGWWCFLALLVAIAATAPTGWLPCLANAMIREYLGVRELSAIQIHVERLTLWNLRFALQLGTNAPVSQIDHIHIGFSPGGLRHARIDRVEVDGGLLQFRAATHGMALCGLPSNLVMRLRPGASPMDDEEVPPQTWQVGKVLIDNVTLRLLPPEDSGSSGNGGASSASPAWRRGAPSSSPKTDSEPFDVCLHASAVTDSEGETRFAVSDYGRAGALVNGAVRFDTGDGWLVAVLPDSQVQEWLRVAQWYVTDPRFQGGDLCAGNGGATFLARMEQWRPALVQGDLSLRAATLLQDCNLTYDLRLHGVAQWEDADSLCPTVSANADLGVRMASCPAFAWSDDRELPAHIIVALQLTPQRTEWECQLAAHAVLSHEAVQACLPPVAGVTTEAMVVQLDGKFTSPDLQLWGGEANAMAIVPQPRLTTGGMALACSDLVVHATARIADSACGVLRVRVDTFGLKIAGSGAACEAELGAAFESRAPFDLAALAVTARVASLTLPTGALAIDDEKPLQAIATATLRRAANGAFGFDTAKLQMSPTPMAWKSGTGVEAAALVSLSGNVEASSNQLRIGTGLHVTNLVFHAGDLTGGLARIDVTAAEDLVRGLPRPAGLRIDAVALGGWLQGANGLLLDGLQVRLPLENAEREIRVIGTPELTWSNLECRGVHVLPEGFALALTGQTATAQLRAGIPDTGLHVNVTLDARADWSHAWQVAVTAAVPPTTLVDSEALRSLVRKFAGKELNLTGEVSVTASALLAADKPPMVRIVATVTNLDIGCAAEKWQVSGLATCVEADGPRAWRTPQGQVLAFQSAKAGDLVWDGGMVRWQFRHDALLVEQADVRWCDGWLHTYGVPLDLHDPRLEADLYAERIELGRLLQQAKALQGTGTGRLYGRIPVKADRGGLRLEQSYLYSMPGETGILKLTNVDLIDQALEQGRTDAKVRQQVCEALHNLRYSVLRMDLSGGGTNAVMGFQVLGRSVEQPAAPPVELDVNLHAALEEFLNFGLQTARKWK